MKKFLVAIVAALVAAVAVFGLSASAAEIVVSGSCGTNLTWTLDESGLLTISGTGEIGTFTDKNGNTEWRKTYPVYRVVIGDGVTRISNNVFYEWNSIETVTFGNGLQSIGDSAFEGCSNLLKINIPDSVTKIGKNAFSRCLNIVTITLSNNLSSIEPYTFYRCENLKNIDIPNGVKTIGTFAFARCNNLKTLKLPSSIESIGASAFGDYYFGAQTRLSSTMYAGNQLAWENVIVGGDNNLGTISYTAVTPATVTLTYNANGGIEPPSPVTVASGSAVTISGEKLSRRNYEFLGWSRTATGAVEFTGGNTITVNADTTLYAVWKSTATFATEIILRIDDKAAQVNGATVQNDVAPIIENSRTMLPARFVAEKLGATVAWDDVARKVIITGADGTKIEIVVDSATAYVNGVEHTLDSPAFIRDARTYTPVRFICDNLGANVQWDGVNRIVTITK